MIRVILFLGTFLSTAIVSGFADEPSQEELRRIPQYRRVLAPEDASRVAELERQAISKNNILLMISILNEIVELRANKQGRDHYETMTMTLKLRNIERMAKLSHSEVEDLDVLNSERKEAERKMNDGLFFQAQSHLELCLKLSTALFGSDGRMTADAHESLARSLMSRGRPFIAIKHHRLALDIKIRILGEHPDVATCHTELGEALELVGDVHEASQHRKSALDIAYECFGRDDARTATFVHGMATNMASKGEYKKALPYYEIALKLGNEDYPSVLTYAYDLANVLSQLREFEKADTHFGVILQICEEDKRDKTYLLPMTYGGRALNYDRQGKDVLAAAMYNSADRLLDEYLKNRIFADKNSRFKRSDLIGIWSNYSWNLYHQGFQEESLKIARKAWRLYDTERLELGDGMERSELNIPNPRIALSCMISKSDPSGAWELMELSLARGTLDHIAVSSLSGTELVEYEKLRSEVVKWRGNYDKTLREHRTLLDELKKKELNVPEAAKKTPNYEKYVKLTQDQKMLSAASVEVQQYGREMAEWKLKVMDAKLSIRQVAPPEAIQKAIPADAALIMWVGMSSPGVAIEHYVVVVRNTGKPQWERLPGAAGMTKWSDEYAESPRKLRTALANSDARQDEVNILVKQVTVERVAPALKHLRGVNTIYAIPANEMAGVPVELLMPDKVVSYVPSGTFLVRAKEKKPLTGQKMLALGDPIFAIPGEKLTTPKQIPPGGALIMHVMPGGAASKIPLEPGDVILKYGSADIKDPESIETAIAANINEKSVSITIWRNDFAKTVVRNVKAGRLGVVFDQDPAPIAIRNRRRTNVLLAPLARGGDWKDLPGTRIETNLLQHLLSDACVVLNDGDASEERLEAMRKSGELGKFRYLHFATHGAGNWVNAFESSLILSQDKLPKDTLPKAGEPFLNGQLSAREVLDFWKLNAELVTLSACETATGKASSGDGSLGFAQAFLHAGSSCVCLSLWKVDDVATALLMDRFYQNLLGKRDVLRAPMSKAAALDEAKRWLRNLAGAEASALAATMTKGVARGNRGTDAIINPVDLRIITKDGKPFAHPRYWAAFVLVGDPN
jgi:tetratricopeptide (TPR) repeat protein